MWIRFCCACAIMLAAFAHQPLAASDSSSPASQYTVSNYTLPDGTVLSLCLYTPGEDNAALSTPCEFCRIADGAIFAPPLPTCVALSRAVDKQPIIIVADHLQKAVFEPATPLRGPPVAV